MFFSKRKYIKKDKILKSDVLKWVAISGDTLKILSNNSPVLVVAHF